MSTVIVAGAGSSLAQAQSFRPKRDREHPPLDGNFFACVTRISGRTATVRAAMTSLRNAIAAVPEFYDPWVRRSVTMEQFFADIYYSVASSPSASAALAVFIDTLQLYRRVLAQTTNWMTRTTRRGDLDRLIRHQLATAEPASDTTVVTFNHDLVIESVAADLPRFNGMWCLRSLYGDVDLRPLNWRSGARYLNHHPGCPHSPPFTLLKLHGSLNWLIRSVKERPDSSTLFPPQRTRRKVHVSNHADILMNPKIGARPQPGGRSWYMWPLVVPPIYEKQRITGMRLLQEVWDRADAAIRRADRIVIFGYSVPDGDVLARQMLRTAVRQNTSLTCVDCINPDATVAAKLREVLDVKAIRLFADVDTYLKHA